VSYVLVSSVIYSVLVYRSHSTQRRFKSEPEIATELLEDYLMECDLLKMGIAATEVMLFCCFEVLEEGFLLSNLAIGGNFEL
jgi:hypothetical protein